MELFPKNKYSLNRIKSFIISFYLVGFLGFLIPATRELFILLTPPALILSVYLLGIYHTNYNLKTVAVFVFVFLSGYFIEVIGVETGLVFGTYYYGKALGLKVFETPLMIGVNWLFLTYAASSIVKSLSSVKWVVVLSAPLLMVVYDIVMEIVAPKMDMWYWQDGQIPLQNYIAWYLIGVFLVSVLEVFKINTANKIAKTIFFSQFLFFVLLSIVYKMFL